MRKNFKLPILFLLCGVFYAPLFAQNVLDNLKLAQKVDIFFETSKSNLTNESIQDLAPIVAKYKQDNRLKIRITAHTDGQGSQQENYILSDKRANSVKYYFIGQGISPEALVASTFGKDKPLADNTTEGGRKMNRRATVEIYEPAAETVKVVEKQVIVEKPVVQIQTVEKIVEKPVVIEKQVVVEKPVVQERIITEVVQKSAAPTMIEADQPYLQGVIQDRDSKTGVPAMIFVRHLTGKVDSLMTDKDGVYKLLCAFNEIVTVDVFAKGYFYNSQDVVIKPNAAQKIELQPLQVGSVATISNLYFVGNEATLLKSSDAEMAKILRFMQLNKDITIEIAGHVNAPGVDPKKLPKEEFNISTKRALTIRKFLIANGFSDKQISGKGYGNSQMRYPDPINEQQEELNRRVEIKVLGVQ